MDEKKRFHIEGYCPYLSCEHTISAIYTRLRGNPQGILSGGVECKYIYECNYTEFTCPLIEHANKYPILWK